jgi:2,4-dienoyl-CoA reductase-like NADH-dependent reductase (Old Yellow Enzyme family)
MTGSVNALFQPFHSDKLSLPNRLVMAPMTRSRSPGGVPGEDVAAYYRRRVENDIGLIIGEATLVGHAPTLFSDRIPRFYGDDALAGWQRVVDEVHAGGGKIAPQLWHLGMVRDPQAKGCPDPNVPSVGPSGLTAAGEQRSQPMTQAEIDAVVRAFAQGAADAQRLGFDAVEIHGAHGYLIDQFFWAQTNRRSDAYGGSLANRSRFAIEIVEAIRAAVGPSFPIIFRFSQWKEGYYDNKLVQNPAELAQFLEPLTTAGVDIFHASTRRFWEPEFEGSGLNLAGWAKKLTGRPAITVGSVGLSVAFAGAKREESGIRDIDDLLERLAAGEFDLVAVGRALLGDPAWARKIREERHDELQPFSPEVYKTPLI